AGFRLSAPTTQQRIVRAKKRIAKTGIPFGRPGPDELIDRLPGVLRVVSLIFNHGINAPSGATHTRVALQREALRLARLLADLLPTETEVRGLLALLLLTHASDRAPVSADGSPVYLSAQDRRLCIYTLILAGIEC